MLNSNMFGEKAGFILGRVIGEHAAIFLRGLYFFLIYHGLGLGFWGWGLELGLFGVRFFVVML